MLKLDGPKSLFMRSVIDRVSCCYRLVIHSVKTLTIITNLDLSVNNCGPKTAVSDHVLTVETLVSQLGGTRKTCENLAVKQTCHNWVARWNFVENCTCHNWVARQNLVETLSVSLDHKLWRISKWEFLWRSIAYLQMIIGDGTFEPAKKTDGPWTFQQHLNISTLDGNKKR